MLLIEAFQNCINFLGHLIYTNTAVCGFIKSNRIYKYTRVYLFFICRLARHLSGLKALGYTLHKSYKEFGLLLLFILIGLLVFASLAYYTEYPENAKFDSIPTAAW